MSAPTHTPGPWQSDTQYIHAPSNRFLAVLKDGPEQVANSRLIAAAPCLLAALKHSAAMLARIKKHLNENGYAAQAAAVTRQQQRNGAAIARVEGRA
jgi:hypothetical protein